jgi:hypothetical protein
MGNHKLPANSLVYIPVRIINFGKKSLFSAINNEKGLYLEAGWYKNDKLYEGYNKLTPLELDVTVGFVQDIVVRTPPEAGVYNLKVNWRYNSELIKTDADKLIEIK